MPWWFWTGSIVGALLLLLRSAVRSSRLRVRLELIQYIHQHMDDWRISNETEYGFELSKGDVTGQTDLHGLYAQLARLPDRSPTARRKLFELYLASFTEQLAAAQRGLSMEQDGHRILPRLVRPQNADMVSTPLDALGLRVCYVLDAPHGVAHVTEDMLTELGISLGELHERALENLRARTPADAVNQVLAGGNAPGAPKVSLVSTGDTYDAARLLAIPPLLADGQAVGAAIPDRDTLVLFPCPSDDDWSRGAAISKKVGDGPRLLTRPIRVTSAGFELK